MTRKEIISDLEVLKQYFESQSKAYPICLQSAIETLKEKPSIVKPRIVMCKDCKHYIPSKEMPHKGWCDDALQNVFKEDFYCAFGERR